MGKNRIYGLIVYSYNGINWLTSISGSNLLGKGIGYDITLSGGVLNVIGNNSIIGSSFNGVDWYNKTTNGLYDNNKSGVGYGIVSSNTRTVIVGKYLPNQTTINKGIVSYIDFTSSIWVKSITGTDFFGDYGEGKGVVWGGSSGQEKFVAVGKNNTGGIIIYSSDAVSWTKSISGSDLFGLGGLVYNVIWNVDKFFAVGKNNIGGIIISSSNGIDWQLVGTPSLFTPIPNIIIPQGKVYVYNRYIENGNIGWLISQKLSPIGSTQYFGTSLSLSCDDLIIGDTGNNSVYCYMFDGTSWNINGEKISGLNTVQYSNFGKSISISPNGEIFAVGGSGDMTNNTKGGVWIYIKDISGKYMSYLKDIVLKLPLDQDDINDIKDFGYNVLISPDFKNLIISCKYIQNNNGGIFIYEIRNQSFYLVYKTKPDENNNEFGKSIVISSDNNILKIGSPSLTVGQDGYIYIYKKKNGNWTYFTKYNNSNMLYGSSLSLHGNGNLLCVGIPSNDSTSSIIIHS